MDGCILWNESYVHWGFLWETSLVLKDPMQKHMLLMSAWDFFSWHLVDDVETWHNQEVKKRYSVDFLGECDVSFSSMV